MFSNETISFGTLLKQLRKRAGMTQGDLAAALDCSDTHVSNLEKGQRRPDLDAVIGRLIPALGLQDEPATAALLIERAATARGERPHASVTLQRATRIVVQEERDEQLRQLPSPPTALIGRTAEANQICNRLLGHSGRLLTLVGPPGIGKTRLALAVAERLQHHYSGGTVFVALAEIDDPVLMASTISAAVGVNNASPKPPKTKLIEFLRRKSMLLVLDNCEQIREAAPYVADLLTACAGVVILATSRERLHLRAEQRHRVLPLDLESAVDLFSQRAAAVDAGFELTAANRPTVEAICQQLDRLPLALELCAAQTDLLPLPQLLAHLHERCLDLLVRGAHDLPPRQRTLRHAIQRSYVLLSEEESTLFRSLGIFAGGFALPELEMVSAWTQEGGTSAGKALRAFREPLGPLSILHALTAKSLVQVQTMPLGEQRFVLLEMIRAFAVEQLQAHGEESSLREAHFAAYLRLFRRTDSHLRGVEAASWLARLRPELDNLRAALQWSLDEARYEQTAWMMIATSYFWTLSGYRYEEARWLAKLLPDRHMLAPDLRLATLLTFYGAAMVMEEFQPVARYAAELIQLLEGSSEKSLQACAWYFLGCAASDIFEAAAAFEQAIACARAAKEAPALGIEFGAIADHSLVLASALSSYASALIEQGEVEQAVPLYTESLTLYQMQGDPGGIAECSMVLGRLALLQGDLTRAHTLLHEAVTIAVALNQNELLGASQQLLGLVTLYEGNTTEARRLLSESLRLGLELKGKGLLARVCACLAEAALREGELGEAEQWLAQSLTHQAKPLSTSMYQVERLWIAARLATAQQQHRRAAALLGLAEQMHGHIRYAYAGPIRDLVKTALATVRETLGAELFVELFTTGQQLSLDEAFATILAPTSLIGVLTKP